MSTADLDLSILWPAFLAGLLVAATHVPLGMQVLARGIVFIDIAIAQIAGCACRVCSTSDRCAVVGSMPGFGSSAATSFKPSHASR